MMKDLLTLLSDFENKHKNIPLNNLYTWLSEDLDFKEVLNSIKEFQEDLGNVKKN